MSVKCIHPAPSPTMQQVLRFHDVILGGLGNLPETQRLPRNEGLCTSRTMKVDLNSTEVKEYDSSVEISCG